jgi:parvulin-like peptidyl-prolyl isomerase
VRTPTLLLPAALALAALAACDGRREAPAAAPRARVLATVNGTPITEADVDHRTRRSVTGGGPAHEATESVLQTLVREELVYQRGLQLGLDAQPEYRARVEDLEAQLRTYRRQEMAALHRQHVQGRAVVTDAEAQAWFEQNADLVRTRFHVLQILAKGDASGLQRDLQDLRGGAPFEQVAARRFPVLPAAARAPWDLGELAWHQLPKAWRGVVDRLEPGQVSDLVHGEGGRLWVLKLAGKRVDPAVTLATERERIGEALRAQKAEAAYASELEALKARAEVTYPR